MYILILCTLGCALLVLCTCALLALCTCALGSTEVLYMHGYFISQNGSFPSLSYTLISMVTPSMTFQLHSLHCVFVCRAKHCTGHFD